MSQLICEHILNPRNVTPSASEANRAGGELCVFIDEKFDCVLIR